MKSPKNLRTLSKYIVEYSFLFPLVLDVSKFIHQETWKL